MALRVKQVSIPVLPPQRFASVLDAEEYSWLENLITEAVPAMSGRVVWNVNSTARGGGVAEMLVSLLAYARGVGVDARWVGDPGDAGVLRASPSGSTTTSTARPATAARSATPSARIYDDALRAERRGVPALVRLDDDVVHRPRPADRPG